MEDSHPRITLLKDLKSALGSDRHEGLSFFTLPKKQSLLGQKTRLFKLLKERTKSEKIK
jgi:hypothetical protein